MPKGRVPAREVYCKACGQPFVTDKVGKAAQLCHSVTCDERRAGQRKAARRGEVEANAQRRTREAAERRAQRERERALEREERARRRKVARAAQARQKTIEAKLRKKGLEIFAPIMDDPDQMKMVIDILEICELASGLRDTGWVELRKAITAVAHAKPEGREASHRALKRLSAVSMRMADTMRTHAVRDPKVEEAEGDRELVAA